MKAYWRVEVQSMHSLISALDGVSEQLYAPASLPPVKEPLVPMEKEAGWAQEPVWTRWRNNSQLLPGLESPIIQPVA
jgi:hypothetical protein